MASSSSSASNAFFSAPPAVPVPVPVQMPPVRPAGMAFEPIALPKWDAGAPALSRQIEIIREDSEKIAESMGVIRADAEKKVAHLNQLGAELSFARLNNLVVSVIVIEAEIDRLMRQLAEMESKYYGLQMVGYDRKELRCPCCDARVMKTNSK